MTVPLPPELPHQGAIPRSPLGGVELLKTIKLIAGGSLVGTISFKLARYYRKPLYHNLFDSSSSEDGDDAEVESVAAKNIDDDKQHIAQSGDTSDEVVSKTTATIVNLDHTKEFQDCMDLYEIRNGVH